MASRTGILFFFSLFQVTIPCNVWMNGIGTVNPFGDVFNAVGKELKIDCTLDHKNKNVVAGDSKNLNWKINGKPVPSEYITVIDNYTAELLIPNMAVGDSGMYSCVFQNETKPMLVCQNNVNIGYHPKELPVNDFSCIAPDWEYLTCSFTDPQPNLNSKYILTLLPIHKKLPSSVCPLKRNKFTWTCNITANSSIIYLQSRQKYYFLLNATNKLGDDETSHVIDHYSRVLPNEPNIFIESVSARNMTVHWKVPEKWKNFLPGLVYRFYYRSNWDPLTVWHKVDLENESATSYVLQELQPYTNYSIKVSCRSRMATDSRLWSQNATFDQQTLSEAPDHSPTIVPGSFQQKSSLNSRAITIFWQAIPLYQHNGRDFYYRVEYKYNGSIQSFKYRENSATFYDFNWEEAYTFSVYSENEMGRSKKPSVLRVEKKSQIVPPPETFNVIYYDNGTYELSWKPPLALKSITNYTLFWCNSVKPHPFACKGNLSWIYVDHDTQAKNITFKNDTNVNYHFGVTSNTEQATSGIVWATCIIPYNGTINRMKKVSLASMEDQKLKVSWKLDCSERIGIVVGFNIYYCMITKNETSETCLNGTEKTIFVNGSQEEHYTLSGLQPFTWYRVMVSAKTKAGEGELSEPKITRTQESAPSAAGQNFKALQLENNSILLEWDAPHPKTSIISQYRIFVGNESTHTFNVSDEKSSHFNATISYKYGYTNYSFQVVACTKDNWCSPKSKPLIVQTEIGRPEMMSKPDISTINDSHILLTFDPPAYPNGPISDYILKIIRSTYKDGEYLDEKISTFPIGNTKSRDYVYNTQCEDNSNQPVIRFFIQAVNILNNHQLKGPFSEPSEYKCRIDPLMQIIIIATCTTIGIAVLFILFIYGYQRFRRKCREIQNIKIHLPKGLEPDSLKSPDFNSIQPSKKRTKTKIDARELLNQLNAKPQGSPRSRNTSGETRISSSSMDELLQNNGDCKHDQNGDNSSALGSVSSTQTTRSNLSSESGNDLESLPPTTPDMVFMENPMNKRRSLPEMEQNKLDPEAALPSSDVPASYSKFACYFSGQTPALNNGYLPTNSSVPKSDHSAYVLPSTPANCESQPLAYSQIGLAAGTNYMNYPHTSASVPSPLVQETNAITLSPPSYSLLGVSDSLPNHVNPGIGYCAVGLAASSVEAPVNERPEHNNITNACTPPEPDSSEKCDYKPNLSHKPYVPVNSSAPGAMYSRVSLQNPFMSNGYVPQSKMEPNSIQVAPSSVEKNSCERNKNSENTKEDSVSTPSDSLEASSLSLNGSLSSSSKPSSSHKNGYVSLSMIDDASMPIHQPSTPAQEVMKTSQTSDEFDSPGAYSRVVSMTFDDANSNNISEENS